MIMSTSQKLPGCRRKNGGYQFKSHNSASASVATETTSLACDVCRMRKIKCDREQPCQKCRISFHDCVYSDLIRKPKKRTRTLDRVKVLENRLLEIERDLKNLPSSSDSLEPAVPLAVEHNPSNRESTRKNNPKSESSLNKLDTTSDNYVSIQYAIEQGEEFQGSSAERAFMQRVKGKLRELPGMDINLWPRINTPTPRLFQTGYEVIEEACHPTKERALELANACFETYALFAIIHRPTFDRTFNSIYSLDPREYSMEEVQFLPLLYAVVALGCLVISDVEVANYGELVSEGERYFKAGRCLTNLEDSTSLTNLQAIIFMNLYLACMARLTTCYSYLSLTVSLASRIGLHRSLNQTGDLIEQETRKRMFWTVRLLSDYLATMCGMPKLLADDDIDQEMPMEVNDEYIQKMKIHHQPIEEVCSIAGVNAYTRLHLILAKIVKHIYPSRGWQHNRGKAPLTYMVNMIQVREIEEDLRRWVDNIPKGFRLGRDATSPTQLRSQYMICMTYAYVQLMLYRPFLHYLSRSRVSTASRSDKIHSTYAMACVRASHNIIILNEDMWRRGFVIGAKWMATNIMIGAVFTLIYVLLDGGGTENIIEDVVLGRKILEKLGKYHAGAERCRTTLAILIASFSNEHQYIRDRLQSSENESPSRVLNNYLQNNHSGNDDVYTSSIGDDTYTLLLPSSHSTAVISTLNSPDQVSWSNQQLYSEPADSEQRTPNNDEQANSLHSHASTSSNTASDQFITSFPPGSSATYGCIVARPFNALLGQQVNRNGNSNMGNAIDVDIEELLNSVDLDFGQIAASFGF